MHYVKGKVEETLQNTARVPADKVLPPFGPLLVFFRSQKSRIKQPSGTSLSLHVIHFISLKLGHATEVGRGWTPERNAIQPLSFDEYMMEPDSFHFCDKCLHKYDLPTGWKVSKVDKAQSTDSEVSSVSNAISADTESEKNAFRPSPEGN